MYNITPNSYVAFLVFQRRKVNNVEVFIELLEKKLNPYELVNRRIMRKISFWRWYWNTFQDKNKTQ